MVYPLAFALMSGAVMNKRRQDGLDDEDRQRRIAQENEDREYQKGEREFARSERARMVGNRERLTAAAAPVAPTDGTVYQPEVDDDGNPMLPNPTAGTFKVGEQRFTDRATADAAAVAENTPERRVARMSAALEQGGDVTGAQALRTGRRQEQTAERQGKLADLQLDEAQRKHLDSMFDQQLTSSQGWDGLAGVMSTGDAKVRVQKTADGKSVQFVKDLPDGRSVPLDRTFEDSVTGLETARALFSRSLKPEQKVEILYRQAQEKRQVEEQAERVRHNKATEGIQRMAAGTAAAKAAAGAGPAQLSLKDMREFEDDVFKRLGPEFDPKNALDEAERARVTTARNQIATRASGVFRINGERGQPVTAEVALNALQLASNRANVRELQGNDGNVYPVVLVNGAPVIVGPGGPPRAAPAAAPGAPAGAPAAAPPAAAAPPVAGGQPVPFQQFLAQNITTPDGKREISQRIQKELPALLAQIQADTKVMGLAGVDGAVKQRLKARIETAAQEAEMMQAFLAGNAGI